ncbi:MAG TPA: polysaccharide biosynthesis tyrosine autokinase [Terriglobales bacterium]|nr:polysaccharide biosynthesis tyrosine autokinase [Terriglobales bacterium]
MEPAPATQLGPQNLRELSPVPMQLSRTLANHPSLATNDSILRDYLRVLIKRKWLVLGSLAIVFGGSLIATLRTTPIYDAVGSIAINKPDPMLQSLRDGGSSSEDYYYDPTDLDTEVRILRSDLLALQVVKQLNLDRLPEFGGSGAPASSSLELTTDALGPDSPRADLVLASFKSNLRVILEPNTRIIDIHYRSPNKELAAKIVNTVANTYIEQNFKTRFESTMQASDWLSRQLVDLQMKVETSQEKLVKYQKDHQILGIDDKQNITTAKLDELNKELTAAESERMQKESVYRLAEAGDTESAAAVAQGAAQSKLSGDSSALLEKLQEQKADVNIQIAQMSTQFGPAYPKVAQLSNQIKEIDAQIQGEMKKIAARLRGDYLAALQRENMLRAALEEQKQQENKLNESAIEYSFLKRDFETNRTLYEGLLQKLKEAGITAGLRSNNIREVDIARTPTAPAEPNIPRNLGFGFMLGLTSGIGLAFLLEGIDNTVRTPEQAQAISGLPSLGMIPLGSRNNLESSSRSLSVATSKEVVELITQSRPQSQMSEAYRALRTSLLLTSVGAPPKIILITSALPQEGKTTTSINTATVLAQKGTRVLLIDADLRRPSIHKTLGLGPRIGLSNVLTGGATLQDATFRSSLLPNLFIMPAGTPPPNPAELLASAQMSEILSTLREGYDHIVVDTPPTLSVTDAVVLSPCADAVVLVIRCGQTTKPALRRSREILTQVNARVAGVLLNAVDLSSPDYYYYYEYQGKYGHRYYDEDLGSGQDQTRAASSSA